MSEAPGQVIRSYHSMKAAPAITGCLCLAPELA